MPDTIPTQWYVNRVAALTRELYEMGQALVAMSDALAAAQQQPVDAPDVPDA